MIRKTAFIILIMFIPLISFAGWDHDDCKGTENYNGEHVTASYQYNGEECGRSTHFEITYHLGDGTSVTKIYGPDHIIGMDFSFCCEDA